MLVLNIAFTALSCDITAENVFPLTVICVNKTVPVPILPPDTYSAMWLESILASTIQPVTVIGPCAVPPFAIAVPSLAVTPVTMICATVNGYDSATALVWPPLDCVAVSSCLPLDNGVCGWKLQRPVALTSAVPSRTLLSKRLMMSPATPVPRTVGCASEASPVGGMYPASGPVTSTIVVMTGVAGAAAASVNNAFLSCVCDIFFKPLSEMKWTLPTGSVRSRGAPFDTARAVERLAIFKARETYKYRQNPKYNAWKG